MRCQISLRITALMPSIPRVVEEALAVQSLTASGVTVMFSTLLVLYNSPLTARSRRRRRLIALAMLLGHVARKQPED